MASKDRDRDWIISNSLEEIQNYEKGVLTIRGLHYRLVGRGFPNTQKDYKRVISAMIKARWEGLISFDTFSDNDREMIGYTDYRETDVNKEIETAKGALQDWMNIYSKNRWENQKVYPEVFIKKKALQGVFSKPCRSLNVSLGACKGYPSLTFLNEAAERFKAASYLEEKKPVILYFGDYDPSGEDIPRSIEENLKKLGVGNIEVKRILLMVDQVLEWNLPPAPAKITDSRTANWDGLGQVELDAIEPNKLRQICTEAINGLLDPDKNKEILETEENERQTYKAELKKYVNNELSD